MKLVTQEIAQSTPEIGETDGEENPTVWAKFFTPDSSWTWLLLELNLEDGLAFGFAYNAGHPEGAELGYWSMKELAQAKGPTGCPVERDKWFQPKPLSQAVEGECPGAILRV